MICTMSVCVCSAASAFPPVENSMMPLKSGLCNIVVYVSGMAYSLCIHPHAHTHILHVGHVQVLWLVLQKAHVARIVRCAADGPRSSLLLLVPGLGAAHT